MPDEQGQGRIAIIGMGIRLPGAGRDLDRFWSDVESGTEVATRFDLEQLRGWGVPAETAERPDFVPVRSVVDGYDEFDGRLFGYSPHDSVLMDPQQRILLECAWSAMEHAGYPPIAQDGNRIAVHVGTGVNVYLLDLLWPNARALKAAGGLGMLTASDKDYAATRIAYKLNLQGPAFSVQTACSTSLVAVHLAVQSLLTYDADVALAGGASIQPPTRRGYLYEQGGIFSPDGRCRTFDAAAQGTLGADGAGIVVLKRLEDALRDNDTVHAVIAGSALSNDGARKAGFTAPGPQGQAAAIRAAYSVAGVDPDTVGLIESHGTATALGDPIEISALREVFGTDRGDRPACALGALKSIMGHADTAAGVAGLIKTVLALEHRTIPPVAGFAAPNPALELEKSVFYVPTAAREFPEIDGVRRAGVSSFGIGGTNAHVVLEEAPPRKPVRRQKRGRIELIMVSAKTEEAATESLERIHDHIAGVEPHEIHDIAYTLRTGRAQLPWRGTFIRTTDLDMPRLRPVRRIDPKAVERGVGYFFTGGGVVPGSTLTYDLDRHFHDTFDRGYAELAALDADPNPEDKNRALRFAVGVGWFGVLRQRGVYPVALSGQGVGALVMACSAGVLTFTEGITLAARKQLTGAVPAEAALPLYTPQGTPISPREIADLGYWSARSEEEHSGEFEQVPATHVDPATWLEIGTQVRPHVEGESPEMFNGYDKFLTTLGLLWELGIGEPWDGAVDRGRSRVPVPGYPFAATRHYLEIPATTKERQL